MWFPKVAHTGELCVMMFVVDALMLCWMLLFIHDSLKFCFFKSLLLFLAEPLPGSLDLHTHTTADDYEKT